MVSMAAYSFTAALIAVGVAAICYVIHVAVRLRPLVARMATAGGPTGTTTSVTLSESGADSDSEAGRFGGLLAWLGLGFLLMWLVFRWAATGHAPYANQFEFATAFALGALGAFLIVQRRYGSRTLGGIVVPAVAVMLLYANWLPDHIVPLVPALQSWVLTIHVAMAIVSYGTFCVAAGAALLYLANLKGTRGWLPSPETSDEIAYKAVIIGFPAQALLLMLGAYWASIAWGRYWGWDPKETAALVTWLIYAGYLHARALRGWQGRGTAVLLLIGFGAVVFTFLGNHFLGGLHAYGGM